MWTRKDLTGVEPLPIGRRFMLSGFQHSFSLSPLIFTFSPFFLVLVFLSA